MTTFIDNTGTIFSAGQMIGSGAFSTVLECKNLRSVVIKTAKLDVTYGKQSLETEKDIFKTLGSDCPNVVAALLTFGDNFIILERFEADLLTALFDATNPLNRTDRLSILEDLIAALEFIHKRGVLHLDIKPENILITRPCKVALSDFGLARRMTDRSKDDQICGNYSYMSTGMHRLHFPMTAQADLESLAWFSLTLFDKKIPWRHCEKSAILVAKDKQKTFVRNRIEFGCEDFGDRFMVAVFDAATHLALMEIVTDERQRQMSTTLRNDSRSIRRSAVPT